jgi:hypothetical protein
MLRFVTGNKVCLVELTHNKTCLFQSGGDLSSHSSHLSHVSSRAGDDIRSNLAKDGSENGEVDYKKVSPRIQHTKVGKKESNGNIFYWYPKGIIIIQHGYCPCVYHVPVLMEGDRCHQQTGFLHV